MAEQKGLIKKDPTLRMVGTRDDYQTQLQQLQSQPSPTIKFKGMDIPDPKHTQKIKDLQNKVATENKRIKAAGNGKNLDGSYIRPEYESLINPETGLMNPEYQLADDFKGTELDSAGYNQFSKEALRDPTQSSAWGSMMLQNNEINKQKNIDDISAQQNASVQGAYDQLAAQGGIGSGSREALAMGSIRDTLMGRQGARRDAQQEALGIRTQDETNRVNQLGQLPGMEINRANFNAGQERDRMGYLQHDTGMAVSQMDKERQSEMDAWMKNQEVWAANKQADAQKSSSGSCFPKDTMVTMKDGSKKPIQEITAKEEISIGGEVTSSILSVGIYQLYDYLGVKVTGDHAVFEDGKFVRVKDSKKGTLTDEYVDTVYSLATEDHKIIINDIMFADYDESDNQELAAEDSLKELNENLHVC